MRTSEQITAEIAAKFGFVPPFFGPALQTPEVLENLWQQTLAAYVNNPLPPLFKEKLFAYLSRYCAVPYCTLCHSCSLYALGMTAGEVLDLLKSSPPKATEISERLSVIAAQPSILTPLPSNSPLEESLLYCSIFIFLKHDEAEYCCSELRRILGPSTYAYLVTFITYVKTCHVWMEAHPEVAYEADKRVQDNLAALLKDEPGLADFFQNYVDQVRREHESGEAKLVQTMDDSGNRIELIGVSTDITEPKQAKAALRLQNERERLVVEIGQRIRQSLNLEEILNTTVSEVRQFLQVDRVFIYRFEPDWGGIVVVESVGSDWKSILGSRLKDPTFAESHVQSYKQGRIQATADICAGSLSQCYIDFLTQFEVRANLLVPILQGELWGLLVANHCLEPRQWQQLEIDLLKQLATQLAIAIQQSTLFEQVQTELAERKQAEQKIREQAALLDITTDAILVRDLNNQILFWNKGAERLYGWKTEVALGKNAGELLYEKTAHQLEEAQKALVEKGKWQGELRQVTKDKKEIIVESRWTLVHDREEKPKSILIVNTDITQKKQLETQFLRAQRLESIGTLASGIAHDLNNVLAPMLMSAQLLQMKIPPERSQRLLKTIEDNAKRGAALVKQVLSFSRGLEGKRTILQVRHLILEIKHIATQTFPKSIEFYTDVSPELWSVSGDATQLHQVLMNLCVNARDAMPDGGTLSIAAENLFIDENYAQMHLDASVGLYIVISVADTGIGIPPEIVDRIFEPFFTTKELGKGTGLGLSTVTGIIKSHSGFVNVYSDVGRGTEFKVYLPAAEGTETLETQDLEIPTGHRELILVVDDEATICETTKTSLETYNYQVLTATDGIEAIALYAQHKDKISIVLIDMIMPCMDGPTTIRTLQKINPKVRTIAVSGLTSSDKLTVAMGSGVKAFLSKPFTAQELLKTIDRVLNQNQENNARKLF